ncbi:rCG24732 [Rattus norvegicus]|uniref:RCG24732 n=1 Tax=Rattus norvegicus TaxID=10116 RepID=A6JC15_RAT|nr:rCG24732 [Rattus norvegicus]
MRTVLNCGSTRAGNKSGYMFAPDWIWWEIWCFMGFVFLSLNVTGQSPSS